MAFENGQNSDFAGGGRWGSGRVLADGAVLLGLAFGHFAVVGALWGLVDAAVQGYQVWFG